jgi:hypothetical protein
LCSPLRKWRNRRLAHSDYPTIVGEAQASLPKIALADDRRSIGGSSDAHEPGAEAFFGLGVPL